MSSAVNVAGVERWASAIGGAALTAYALKQLKERSPAGAMLAAAGTALIYRGATGHCGGNSAPRRSRGSRPYSSPTPVCSRCL